MRPKQAILSPHAEEDLSDIGVYTEKQWGKRQRQKYITQLINRIKRLAKNPALGRQRYELLQTPYSYHEGRHVIFYRLTAESIEVIRVLHDSMDFPRHFQQN
jgi:toxin ParE1/3/4